MRATPFPSDTKQTTFGGSAQMNKTIALVAITFGLAAGTAHAEGMGGTTGMAGMVGMAGTASPYGKQMVVYHINSYGAQGQTAALRNIQNHINAVGATNLDLKVVMHGDGLSLLLPPDAVEGTKMKEGNATDEMGARIAGLKQQGVKFEVCANTLKGRNVKLEDLYDSSDEDVVRSGVAELARLQGMGYTYIKP
jgi:intracellular sulfur oxidation DsrE/DsrF family protein